MADGSVIIDIDVSAQTAEKKIKDLRDKIKSLTSVSTTVKIDTTNSSKNLRQLEATLKSIINLCKTSMTISIATGKASSKIDSLTNTVKRLKSTMSNQVAVKVTTANATKNLKSLEDSAKRVTSAITKNDTFNLNTTQASSKLRALNSALDNVSKNATGEKKVVINTEYANKGVKKLNTSSTKFFNLFSNNSSSLKGVTSALEGMKSSFSSTASGIRNSLKSIENGFGGIISKIELLTGSLSLMSLGKNAVKTASDLQEVQNVVDTIFGDMSDSVSDWSKTTKDKFGIAELTAKDYASQLGALYKDFGFEGKGLATISETMTELIADYASFQNIGFEAVFDSFQSAISGSSTKTLKDYGISLTEATLDTYSLSQGLDTVYSKMSDVDKAILRTSYILHMSSAEAGDFTKTSDSWANTLRTLGQTAQEGFTILGQGLIVALKPALDLISILLDTLIAKATTFKAYVYTLFDVDEAVESVAGNEEEVAKQSEKVDSISKDLIGSLDGVGDQSKKTSKSMKSLLAPIDELNILSSETAESLDSATDDLSTLANTNLLGDYPVMNNVAVKKTVEDVKATLNKALSKIDVDSGLSRLANKINLYFTKHTVSSLAINIANWINKGVVSAYKFLSSIDFTKIGEYIKNSVLGFFNTLNSRSIGVLLSTAINSAVDFAYGFLKDSGSKFSLFGSKIATLINSFFLNLDTNKIGETINSALADAAAIAYNLFIGIDWSKLGDKLGSGINSAVSDTSTFATIGKAISSLLKGVLDFTASFLKKTDWKAVGNAIGTALKNIDWGSILKDALDIIHGLFTALFDTLGAVYNNSPVAGLLLSISGSIVAISGATKAATVVSGVASALMGFSAAHPLVAIITTIATALTVLAALGASWYADTFIKKHDIEPYESLSDEQREVYNSIMDTNAELEELARKLKETGDEADNEYDKYGNLVDRLGEIVDENGKVKAGYEETAKYIVGELNDAYNLEIELVDGQIKGYQNLTTELEKAYKKKKALTYQEAFSEDYKVAIAKQSKLKENLNSAEQGYERETAELKELADFLNEYGNKGALKDYFKDGVVTAEALQIFPVGDYNKLYTLINAETLTENELPKAISAFSTVSGIAVSNADELRDAVGSYTEKHIEATNEMLIGIQTAKKEIKVNDKLIDNFEEVNRVLEDSTSTTEDYDLALSNLSGSKLSYKNVDISDSSDLEEIFNQMNEAYEKYIDYKEKFDRGEVINENTLKELEDEYLAQLHNYKLATILFDPNANSELKQLIVSSADNTSGVYIDALIAYMKSNSKTVTESDFIEFYTSLFGTSELVNIIPVLISSGFDKNKIFNAVMENADSMTTEQLNSIVKRLYGVEDGSVVNEALTSAFKEGKIDADSFFAYLEANADSLTDTQLVSLAKEIIPEDKWGSSIEEALEDDTVNGVINAIKNFVNNSDIEMTEDDVKKLVKRILPDSVSDEWVDRLTSLIMGDDNKQSSSTTKDIYTPIKLVTGFDISSDKVNGLFDKFKKAGNNAAQGYAKGISEKTSEVEDAAESMTKSGLDTIKEVQDSHSPSKETEKLGKYASQGYALGISSEAHSVKTATENLVKSAISGVSGNSFANKVIMMTYGLKLITGFKDGIVSGGILIKSAISTISDNIVNSFSDGFTNVLDNVDIFYFKLESKWTAIGNMLKSSVAGKILFGGIDIDDSSKTVKYPSGNNTIPKLANGAVIKPNNEFMAILGDQHSGVNIETPLDTMVSAFKTALSDSGVGSGVVEVPVYIGNELLDRYIVNLNSVRSMRNNGRG